MVGYFLVKLGEDLVWEREVWDLFVVPDSMVPDVDRWVDANWPRYREVFGVADGPWFMGPRAAIWRWKGI